VICCIADKICKNTVYRSSNGGRGKGSRTILGCLGASRNDVRKARSCRRPLANVRRAPIVVHSLTRNATTPLNSILNYSYALLEIETRVALASRGLDCGLGMFHVGPGKPPESSSGVMEPVRSCQHGSSPVQRYGKNAHSEAPYAACAVVHWSGHGYAETRRDSPILSVPRSAQPRRPVKKSPSHVRREKIRRLCSSG
jgi:CRISPR associated protein Cas1